MFRTIPNGSILLRGELFVIKLQDFAKECGVTDRAIQKHLVKYADELNGLYERKGPNGTWLSDAACDILRSKMKQQPIVVSDGSLARQAEELKAENVQLLKELHNVQTDIIELQRQKYKTYRRKTLAFRFWKPIMKQRHSSLLMPKKRTERKFEAFRGNKSIRG